MRALLILAALSLASCGERRSFDERYADTQQNLEERARELDAAANAADANASVD
jgi:cell division protein ZapA (FtsZ GTPase activity inhibitor)